ncbi:hypothetical protein RFEPED_0411 [Rickettsia felis str. Pedreira]|uniref:Uncharacterized protein n=1 Tax=Rickettsia felis str. Pedreira TaxID=1359196 RepID=A0A0F3MQL1_RICFI|nr:hypothetical protein [Rickettsia felis]KJV58040.1 hypothetical protein RFEPED_0411 [Rickettsia felis str. Pedreira]
MKCNLVLYCASVQGVIPAEVLLRGPVFPSLLGNYEVIDEAIQ